MRPLSCVVLATVVLACSRAETESTPAPSPVPSATTVRVRQVPAENVCMVNDRDMGKPQIPVEVDGRTYFGCCAMCKEKLETQVAVRTATDPVTGHSVDKARAVIARQDDGSVLYFESAASFDRHVANIR